MKPPRPEAARPSKTRVKETTEMRNPGRTHRALALALAALVAAAAPAPLAGQSTEGYDPMRQITAQLVKANLLIVLDTSGSMAWDMPGNTLGDGDSLTKYDGADISGEAVTGRLFWVSSFPTSSNTQGGSSDTLGFDARVDGKQTVGGTTYNNDATVNVRINNVRGVEYPGIYTYSAYTKTAPTKLRYRDYSRNGAPWVYATNLPVMSYYSATRYRLVYRCRPVGTWTDGGLVPWSSDRTGSNRIYWQYNTSFDTNDCSAFTWQLKFDAPSRMSLLKNALGNSVYVAQEYTPPEIRVPGSPVTRWPAATSWRYDTSNYGSNPWTTWLADDAAAGGRRNSLPGTDGRWFAYREGYRLPTHEHDYEFTIEPGYNLEDRTVIYNPTTRVATAIPKPNVATPNYVEQPGPPLKAFYASTDTDLFVPDDAAGNPALPYNPLRPLPATIPASQDAKLRSVGLPRPGFGSAVLDPPQDIIAKNASRINFGLQTFSGTTATTFPLITPVDTTDGSNVERLLGHLAPRVSPDGTTLSFSVPKARVPVVATDRQNVTPLSASGSTPTRGALGQAKAIIASTFAGTSAVPLTTSNSSSWSLPADAKGMCNRPYGVILATDGMSNYQNPDNHNWVDPCGSAADGRQCDSGAGYDCPQQWARHAAGISDEIWNDELDPGGGAPKINPRTWVIGMSSAVGPCELDFIAYMGRTDASSPAGDAGFGGYDAVNNPNLPDPAVSTVADPVGTSSGNFVGPNGQRRWNRNTSKWFKAANDPLFPWLASVPEANITAPPTDRASHNAYFAESAKAIGEAFAAIVNATATGDYATNAPVSGMAAAAPNAVYLPSTGFPNWKGNLYKFNINLDPSDEDYVTWNAGGVLASRPASSRKIFTWNPATNDLVEVTQANLTKAPLKDVAGLTAPVLDFIRGNDGSLSDKVRSWPLGPMINSAPAMVAAPGSWTQNTVVDHKSFQMANGGRDALLWVGSNDVMLHAFRATDGIEQIAILPPSLLSRQVTLYNNYVEDPKFPSGQPTDILEHIYGVSNSFRFGDVYFSGEGYKTIGIVTFGAGASDMFAIDVTKVPKPDDSSYPADPVKILWTKTTGGSSSDTTLERLAQTFAIPAMAPVTSNTWRLVGASGLNPGNTRTTQGTASFVAPRTYVLDPTDGSIVVTKSLTSLSTPSPFVGNQAFADSVIFDPKAKAYQEDNVARLGLQADLNGRIWFLYSSDQYTNTGFDVAKVGIDVSTDITPSQSQPIYYNPAASGVGSDLQGCVAYAFGSGSLYERSDLITGTSVGAAPNFVPRIYVATGKKASFTDKLVTDNIRAKAISSSCTVTKEDGSTYTATFGNRTQLTAPPFMLVPKSGTGSNTALFLLYDPDLGCNGFSYVVVVDFEADTTCKPGTPVYKAYDAGVGAASGFTIAGDKVLVSKSGIGEGQRAGLYEPPNITAAIGGTAVPKVRWWKELK